MKELYKKNLQNETFLQLNRFILVGVLNTVITITIFLFLTNFVKLDYRLSNSIGYIIGVINSFIWNKKWTFKTKNSLKSEFLKFIVVFIISYFIKKKLDKFDVHKKKSHYLPVDSNYNNYFF